MGTPLTGRQAPTSTGTQTHPYLTATGLPPVTSGLVGLYSAENWDGTRWSDASGR